MTLATDSSYQIKSYKPFASPEGGGYNAKLYRDGKHVADIHDAGDGGAPRVDFITPDERDAFVDHAFVLCADDLKTIDADNAKWWGMELAIGRYVEQMLDERDVKRHIKNLGFIDHGALVTLPHHKDREAATAYVRERHPDAIILHELPLADAVRAYQALRS